MKIALIGYGKMGHEIEKIALRRGHEVVCRIDADNQEDFESEAFRTADVAIEFTCPAAAYGNCLKALQAGVKTVSGSTGWFAEHREEMEQRCQQGGTLFWSSNFSLGVAIFSAVNNYLATIMNQFPDYDVQMSETHHVHKLDAPSGTAITLAEGILSHLDRKQRWYVDCPRWHHYRYDRLSARPVGREQHPRGGGAGYSHHPLRERGRQHHHHPRRQEPQRLCPGRRAGCRIYGSAPRPAGDE